MRGSFLSNELKADESARHTQENDREDPAQTIAKRLRRQLRQETSELRQLREHEEDLSLKLDSHGLVPKGHQR